jgi:ribosomal protein L12E/L44/L45/RPP1/RPP2
LHHLLVGAPRVDDASKRLLREVLGDIEKVLDQAPSSAAAAVPSAAAPSAAPAQALPRLEAIAVEFEAEHPALSAGLREFIDLLGRAGL